MKKTFDDGINIEYKEFFNQLKEKFGVKRVNYNSNCDYDFETNLNFGIYVTMYSHPDKFVGQCYTYIKNYGNRKFGFFELLHKPHGMLYTCWDAIGNKTKCILPLDENNNIDYSPVFQEIEKRVIENELLTYHIEKEMQK